MKSRGSGIIHSKPSKQKQKQKNFQPRTIYPAKLSFKYEVKNIAILKTKQNKKTEFFAKKNTTKNTKENSSGWRQEIPEDKGIKSKDDW